MLDKVKIVYGTLGSLRVISRTIHGLSRTSLGSHDPESALDPPLAPTSVRTAMEMRERRYSYMPTNGGLRT